MYYFIMFDLDGSAYLDFAEAIAMTGLFPQLAQLSQGFLTNVFEDMDCNKDGFLSKEEAWYFFQYLFDKVGEDGCNIHKCGEWEAGQKKGEETGARFGDFTPGGRPGRPGTPSGKKRSLGMKDYVPADGEQSNEATMYRINTMEVTGAVVNSKEATRKSDFKFVAPPEEKLDTVCKKWALTPGGELGCTVSADAKVVKRVESEKTTYEGPQLTVPSGIGGPATPPAEP